MTQTERAVLAHSSNSAELVGIARDLCAAAAFAQLTGGALLFARLVDQAAAVLALRSVFGEEIEPDE